MRFTALLLAGICTATVVNKSVLRDDQQMVAMITQVAGDEMVERILGEQLVANMVRGDKLDLDARVDMYIRLAMGTDEVLETVGMTDPDYIRDLPTTAEDFAAGALDIEALKTMNCSQLTLAPVIRDLLAAEADENPRAQEVLNMFKPPSVRFEELSD